MKHVMCKQTDYLKMNKYFLHMMTGTGNPLTDEIGWYFYSDSEFDTLTRQRKSELNGIQHTGSWLPKEGTTGKTFTFNTHDNGARPFNVNVSDGKIVITVNIYSQPEFNDDELSFLSKDLELVSNEVILEIDEFMGLWTGFDPSVYNQPGNSILIKVSVEKYIHVSNSVTSFVTSDEIIDYVAVMGNNNVPYPMAYGINNIFLLSYCQVVAKADLSVDYSIKNCVEFMRTVDNTQPLSLITICDGGQSNSLSLRDIMYIAQARHAK